MWIRRGPTKRTHGCHLHFEGSVWNPRVTSASKVTNVHMFFLRQGLCLNPESTHWLALLAGQP